MSFEKGPMNFVALVASQEISDDFESSIFQEGYSDGRLGLGVPETDFTSGVSLAPLGRDATLDDFKFGQLTYFACRKRELKIDTGTMRERIERAVYDEIARTGAVSSKRKKELKEMVVDALEDTAQERVSGNRVVMAPNRHWLYTDAVSNAKLVELIDSICVAVPLNAYGKIEPYCPEFAYRMATGKNESQYSPFRIGGMPVVEGIGCDFLTWLFMASEESNICTAQVALPGNIEMVDCRETVTGAKAVVLKEGQPSTGREVAVCLKAGKKVVGADFMFEFDGIGYEVAVTSDFVFKKLKVVDMEASTDVVANFLDRVTAIGKFMHAFNELFKEFAAVSDRLETLVNGWIRTKETASFLDEVDKEKGAD